MNIISIAILGLIGALITAILKQYKPEFAIFISIITTVIILSYIISIVLPVISDIKSMINKTSISFEHLSILLKSVGICYLTQFAADACRESGQTAISTKIELAGKVAICLISLPLFHNLVSVIETIIGKVT